MLRRPALLAAAATLIALATTPANAALSYVFDLPLASGSATGTITTNGKMGQLSWSDLISYNIDVVGLSGAVDTLTNLNSIVQVEGSGLSADASHIYFDFTHNESAPSLLLIQKVLNSGSNYVCAANLSITCYEGTTAVPGNVGDPTAVFGHPGGITAIASMAGVPEPATWAMLLAGFLTVGSAMRRQQRVHVAFA